MENCADAGYGIDMSDYVVDIRHVADYLTPIATTGTTADWNAMASVNGTHHFCNWHQPSKTAPSVMSISARSIAITAKAHLSATGDQGC